MHIGSLILPVCQVLQWQILSELAVEDDVTDKSMSRGQDSCSKSIEKELKYVRKWRTTKTSLVPLKEQSGIGYY